MGKGRKKARKAKDLAGSESDASMSDGEMREKRKQEQEAQEGEMKTRLERIKSGYTNKQKTLVLSSRGITHRYRHLMMDLLALLPHARKDSKLDTKQKLYVINEIADMKDCSNCVFFEVRKGSDLYLWFAKVPNGPSIKFHVLNVHTMSELNFTGNCLKGSRPFLSFDANFEQTPQTRIMKAVLSQVFGTPKNHPRSRPFIDHVFSFSWIDGKVWFRNFQVADEVNDETKKIEKTLVEIGPRFVMDPIRILAGGFSGAVLWDNPDYLTPSAERVLKREDEKKDKLAKERDLRRLEKKREELQQEPGELDDVFADSQSDDEDAMDVDADSDEFSGSDVPSDEEMSYTSNEDEESDDDGNGMDVDEASDSE
jgi:ribosome biogenesis protein BRX1